MALNKIEKLIAKLDVQGDHAAEKIISALVKSGKTAVPLLIVAAKNQQAPRIRKWSLQALGAIGDKRAAGVLVEALKDSRMTVKLHALKGLGFMKYKKASKDVATLLKDESGGIRVNALYTLMALNDLSVAPAVLKSLSDEQWYVRQAAAEACGVLAVSSSKRKLKKLVLEDPRKAVRKAAEAALQVLAE